MKEQPSCNVSELASGSVEGSGVTPAQINEQ